MADAPVVVFDAEQYQQLITNVGDVINNLQGASAKGSTALSDEVLLQPQGQTWQPAIDLVAAGKDFFAAQRASLDDSTIPSLQTLQSALGQAKSVFQDSTDDLVKVGGSAFTQLSPGLNVAPSTPPSGS